jgi:hypothetical protein
VEQSPSVKIMKKWTKKDIKTLCQTISTFWLCNRPLGDSYEQTMKAIASMRQFLEKHRKEVVIGGISELQAIAMERAKEDQDTTDHFALHPNVYGKSTPEMIKRFSDLAAENRKDVEKAKSLIARIKAEELPPEVEAFDPISG